MKKWKSFGSGMMLGLVSLSIALAAVPTNRITDDTAMYQNMSELQIARERRLNFDADIQRLSAMETRYKEKLPSLSKNSRISSPMKRIGQQQYRYSRPATSAQRQ